MLMEKLWEEDIGSLIGGEVFSCTWWVSGWGSWLAQVCVAILARWPWWVLPSLQLEQWVFWRSGLRALMKETWKRGGGTSLDASGVLVGRAG